MSEEVYALFVRWVAPAIQIVILYLVLYWVLRSLERISAAVKLKGLGMAIVVIALAGILAQIVQLHAINWLLKNAIAFSAIILAIVFQPEVRRLFTRIGGLLPTQAGTDNAVIFDQLVEAVEYMAQRHIGALVVIEGNTHLDDFIDSSRFDCDLTAKSLVTLFWKDSPLHDGAVIVRNGRVAAAGVILPLTENFEFKDLSGTRHRAGIGISEETDAVSILVSEETGSISVAEKGKLHRNLTRDDFEILLSRVLGMRGRRGGAL